MVSLSLIYRMGLEPKILVKFSEHALGIQIEDAW